MQQLMPKIFQIHRTLTWHGGDSEECDNFNVGDLLENKLILVICGQFYLNLWDHPPGIYLFKADNGNTRKMYEISLKLTIETPEQISAIVLAFLLLILNK